MCATNETLGRTPIHGGRQMVENEFNRWGRKPRRWLAELSTERGERIRDWFHSRFSRHAFTIGIECRSVIFADGRSGWSALSVTVALLFWESTFYPLIWRTDPGPPPKVVTLADQIRATHRKTVAVVDIKADDDE